MGSLGMTLFDVLVKNSDTKKCPDCGKQMPTTAKVCPHCGEYAGPKK